MRLALIPPIDLLDWTDETTMQLMLPHLITDKRYAYTYRAHCNDPNQFVILDNGEAEGVTTDVGSLMSIAADFGVDEVVIPDVIGNLAATIAKCVAFLPLWSDACSSLRQLMGVRLMFVIQGCNREELLQAIEYAEFEPLIDTIGIPRHVVSEVGGARGQYARICSKPVHLLGGSPEHPTEIRDFDWPPNVRSTDTSAPFNFTNANRVLRAGNPIRRPENYFKLHAESFPVELLTKNVDYLIEWTKEARR